jgi:hypothetical protein
LQPSFGPRWSLSPTCFILVWSLSREFYLLSCSVVCRAFCLLSSSLFCFVSSFLDPVTYLSTAFGSEFRGLDCKRSRCSSLLFLSNFPETWVPESSVSDSW